MAPKGVNQKAAEARERKADKKATEKASQQKAKEDAYWADDDKDAKRKQARKEDEEKKKAEAAARKLEAKRLLEEEEKNLKSKAASKDQQQSKMTQFQIQQMKEKQAKLLEQQAKEREALEKQGIVTQDYLETHENRNREWQEMREEGHVVATGLDAAVEALSVNDKEDRHPEKRAKAAREAFMESRLKELKAENPNMRLSQLQQMAYKEWIKSPLNPFNQPGKK